MRKPSRKAERPGRGRTPRTWPYALILLVWGAGAALLVEQAVQRYAEASQHGAAGAVLALVLAIVTLSMSVGLFFLFSTIAKSACYMAGWCARTPCRAHTEGGAGRPVVVLYLTAGDFDETAVDSLLRMQTSGRRMFILHDDGNDEAARRRMHEFVDSHPDRGRWEVRIWHRPRREGGKAGAVNWVLKRLDPEWELMLLCDSDSIAMDADAPLRAECEFDDESVAAVQFRNTSYVEPNEPAFQRRLARAIDVFDALAEPQAVWGYVPFMGHNAMLRLSDVKALGGLTPGFFSDDLDLSTRMTLAGKRIEYRGDLVFAERHPSDALSFRKRSRKWAYGCTQVVRTRALDVVRTRGVPLAHRVGLLEFMAFYPAMLLLLAGLLLSFLVLPWLAPLRTIGDSGCLVIGTGILLALLAPTLAWSRRHGRMRQWPALAISCTLVYGGSIIPSALGVLDGLRPGERPWIPTNLRQHRAVVPRAGVVEAVLGLLLIAVPWMFSSVELSFPSTYLFVSVFLFSPLTFAAYREPQPDERPRTKRSNTGRARSSGRRRRHVAAAARTAAIGMALFIGARAVGAEPTFKAHGDHVTLNGEPYTVRGIHYSPWLPGTGPMNPEQYPSKDVVTKDLSRIADLGANTILVHTCPAWVPEYAWHQHHIATIYQFSINFNDTSEKAFDAQASAIVDKIKTLKDTDGIVMWVLGNEVPPWVVKELGKSVVEKRLGDLAARVRAVDPTRLISHANWPMTKQLDPPNMDVVCFNVYPAWPYEVAIRGYGPYLRQVLAPLAKGRPLLISEFGINTLEASEQRQAQVITNCWHDIQASPTIGGVLLGYSDEWWKNYDNPVPGKDYWERAAAPDDAAKHDADPEEYYGIFRADRTPKAAVAAVAQMWTGNVQRSRSWTPWIVIGCTAIVVWFVLGLHRRGRGDGEEETLIAQDAPAEPGHLGEDAQASERKEATNGVAIKSAL